MLLEKFLRKATRKELAKEIDCFWMEADTYTQTIQIFQTREGEVHTLKFTRKEAALLAKGLERQCEAMKEETGNVSR